MVKERAQKKSFQQSLEDIKERMKEKRNKRLARASAPGRSRMINKSSVANSTHTILKGVQLNNKSLAVALQSEKEKVRQANAIILQLKREQQALFLHLLLLKRKLKEQEALGARNTETVPANALVEPEYHVELSRSKPTCQDTDVATGCKALPVCAESQIIKRYPQDEHDKQVTLPSTVGVRRRHADRRSKRRSEHVWEQRSVSEVDHTAGLEALVASPIHSGSGNQKEPQKGPEPVLAESIQSGALQHSTPEPVPKTGNPQKAKRKQAEQSSTKSEPPARKPERGRKVERAPLKKPWESSKPRTRSKSRDRSATRAKTAPPPQGNKLNTSLGFNDTFDFDCEEAVHITPFKAKVEDNQPATPKCAEDPQKESPQSKASPIAPKQDNSSFLSPSSESEHSLYIPQCTKGKSVLSQTNKVTTTRRGRLSRRKENIAPRKATSALSDEQSSPKAAEREKEEHVPHSPVSSFSNSPDAAKLHQENPCDPLREKNDEECLLPVSPLVEAEMKRIDNVLSNFGDSFGDAPPLLPHQTPQRVKTCKKRGLGLRTAGRGLSLCDVTNLSPAAYSKFPSDARCSTPVPARKRRCTTAVDYKEPSLNAKLRRGDKFTDLEFLQSPIFKQKSDRRSVQKSRKSVSRQKPLEKYNESFVGCR